MNIYGLLRALIEAVTWRSDALKQDALQVVDKLEELNAFGTVAADMKIVAHTHTPVPRLGAYLGRNYTYYVCSSCGMMADEESNRILNQIGRPYR